MPHATSPATGFQAFVLCGPGESLVPFNANPNDFPKALIPIANRPMVWYPLDWCYRMGITDITLLCPSSSAPALEAALSQNPYLTSLPSPRPTVIAPSSLTLTTGTAELFRIPQIQAAITGDFIVLPCDIVCELSGSLLLEAWMTMQGGFGGTNAGSGTGVKTVAPGYNGERVGRRGGLGVWYQTRDTVTEGGVGVKKEETDFLATTELPKPTVPPSSTSLRPHIKNVALAMPTAVLQDVLEEEEALKIRHSLIRKHKRVRLLNTYRDAHIYFFPYWVKEMMARNKDFGSVSEDVVGWWAKAGWQKGLAKKLKIGELFASKKSTQGTVEVEDIDMRSLSSTLQTDVSPPAQNPKLPSSFASRVTSVPSSSTASPSSEPTLDPATSIPQIHSYLHPSHPPALLIRRVDTVPLLLSVSLSLARLPSLSDRPPTPSPLAHGHKIHPTSRLPPHITLKPDTNLIDANVTLSSKSTIQNCVVGANCNLGAFPPGADQNPIPTGTLKPGISAPKNVTGVRMGRSLLMEGAVVEVGCRLNGCVLGRRCRIGRDSELTDCYVQEGFVVPARTVAKGETFAVGMDEEGLLSGDYDDGDLAEEEGEGGDEMEEDGEQEEDEDEEEGGEVEED